MFDGELWMKDEKRDEGGENEEGEGRGGSRALWERPCRSDHPAVDQSGAPQLDVNPVPSASASWLLHPLAPFLSLPSFRNTIPPQEVSSFDIVAAKPP